MNMRMFYSDEMTDGKPNPDSFGVHVILNASSTETLGNLFVLPRWVIVFRGSEVIRVFCEDVRKGDLLLFPCSMEKLLIPIDEPFSIVEVPFVCNGQQIPQSLGVEIETVADTHN